MNILYVYAHPNPSSFNSALKKRAMDTLNASNINIQMSNLYDLQFKAVADWQDFKIDENSKKQYFLAQQDAYLKQALSNDITNELAKIAWADHIILQFPLWWFSTPAILKGWLDRVLVKGFAYDAGKVFQDGLLKGKSASFIVTTQSPETAYQSDGVHQATIDTFLHHINHTFRFVGMAVKKHFVTYAAFDLTESQEAKIFKDLHLYLNNLILQN